MLHNEQAARREHSNYEERKMGIDLLGHGGESFNWSAWHFCLDRATEHGWNPEGTVAPADFDGEWTRTYRSNDFQQVTDRDGRALGKALLRAAAALSIKGAPEDDLLCLRRLAGYALKGG
jgi:hypothetical protein